MVKETKQKLESSRGEFGLNSKQMAALIQSRYALYTQDRL
jgi:hypothetical protein